MSREKTNNFVVKTGFGERLRDVRGGRSQAEFARMVKTSQQNLHNYESEKTDPPMRFLMNVATATGTRLDWLITGEGFKMLDDRHKWALDVEYKDMFPEHARLLDHLERLGISTVEQLDAALSGRRIAAESPGIYMSQDVEFKTDEERAEVEKAVDALVQLAYSYFEFADEEMRVTMKKVFTRAELIRYRRRAERRIPEGVLTNATGGTTLDAQGMRGKKRVNIEKVIADALKEAGPPPSKGFKPTWDVRRKVETAVDNWIKRHDYEVSAEDRSRLIEALVLLDERDSSRTLGPETPKGKK